MGVPAGVDGPPSVFWIPSLLRGPVMPVAALAYIWFLSVVPALVLVALPMLIVPRWRTPRAWVAAIWGPLAVLVGLAAMFRDQTSELLQPGMFLPVVVGGAAAGIVYSILAGPQKSPPASSDGAGEPEGTRG